MAVATCWCGRGFAKDPGLFGFSVIFLERNWDWFLVSQEVEGELRKAISFHTTQFDEVLLASQLWKTKNQPLRVSHALF